MKPMTLHKRHVYKMPYGADFEAFVVSSAICAPASYPENENSAINKPIIDT